jgi:hypothetical protein
MKEHQSEKNNEGNHFPSVNAHIHTPYSFSAFQDVEQAFRMAASEEIKVLGINDFNTLEGYEEFNTISRQYKIYPLFNVEFMGLMEQEQKQGIRINDPANPGRIYMSGKGLDFPSKLSGSSAHKFTEVFIESNNQTREMLTKASELLNSLDKELSLDYDTVMREHTRGMLRERHIAKAIRTKVFEKYTSPNTRIDFMKKLFSGKEMKSSIDDSSALDNEIRSNILKSGGPAYIKEDPKAFLPIDDILTIIRDAGGIPCYPVLLDDNKGMYTEFEADKEAFCNEMTKRNIFCLELIPGRNDIQHLTSFVEFFDKKGFIITFGTEHNSPDCPPLTVTTRGNIPLSNYLKKVNFEGACLIAAHQHLRSQGESGLTFTDLIGDPKSPLENSSSPSEQTRQTRQTRRTIWTEMGTKLIKEYCS